MSRRLEQTRPYWFGMRESLRPAMEQLAIHHWRGLLSPRDIGSMALGHFMRAAAAGKFIQPFPKKDDICDVAAENDLDFEGAVPVALEAYFAQARHPMVQSFVRELLDEAIATVGGQHTENQTQVTTCAARGLTEGYGRNAIVEASANLARTLQPALPAWMVSEAVEKAAREHRFSTSFWRKRERSS